MLREINSTRQVGGESRRRWFSSPRCDLIVWLRDDDTPEGFQFCYDKQGQEHALTWTERDGFSHMRVDSGEGHPRHKGSPLLVPNGQFVATRILEAFDEESTALPAEFARLVAAKLQELAAERSDPPTP